MSYDKDKMINQLIAAKEIVDLVYNETDIEKVGDVVSEIDEAIGAIEDAISIY